MRGKIESLKTTFGFIKIEGETDNLFFHQSELEGENKEQAFDELSLGDTVEFEKDKGPKGDFATNVKKVESAE